jgi:predicted RNA-binding Zn ribbon-like protein
MKTTHASDHEHGLDLETALDFLNTRELDSGHLVDRLLEPADASTWFVEQGVIHPADARRWSGTDLDRVREVRDALHEIVDALVEDRGPAPNALDVVNGALQSGATPRVEIDGATVRIGHRHATSPVDDALATLAAPIVGELASGRPDRFRICASHTCRWTFYDASPTGRRRWCNMKTCGNRAKAARHRERAKLDSPTAA